MSAPRHTQSRWTRLAHAAHRAHVLAWAAFRFPGADWDRVRIRRERRAAMLTGARNEHAAALMKGGAR